MANLRDPDTGTSHNNRKRCDLCPCDTDRYPQVQVRLTAFPASGATGQKSAMLTCGPGVVANQILQIFHFFLDIFDPVKILQCQSY